MAPNTDGSSRSDRLLDLSDSTQVAELIRKVKAGVRKSSLVPSQYRDDIIGNILLECVRKKQKVTWVWITRRCYDELRKASKRKQHEDRASLARGERVDQRLYPEAQDQLDKLINRVPISDIERKVLFEVYYKGHTQREAATQLGISLGKLMRTHQWVLEKLRVAQEEADNDGS